MKFANIIAIAALLGTSVEEVVAIRRHHHHHRGLTGDLYAQLEKVDDIEAKDPKFAELKKKEMDLKEQIEEAETPKELTEEEEKEKFEKEELPKMELEGKKVNNKNQLKMIEKKLDAIEKEKKNPTGEVAVAAEGTLKEKLEGLVKEKATLDSTTIETSAAVDNEVKAKVKDLKEQLAKVEEKEKEESTQLRKVRDKIAQIADTKEYKPDPTKKGGFEDPEAKKPDDSEFKKNLAKIEKDEAEKEAKIEARKEALDNVPKNPVVEASEKAEEEFAAQDKANKIAAIVKQNEEMDKMKKKMESIQNRAKAGKQELAGSPENKKSAEKPLNDEAWTANMDTTAPHFLEGYLQVEVDQLKHQLAQIEAREQESDSDSDSDSSDSDSD